MSFRRSNRGISNQHMFHDVDLIVFVEGGISYSKEDVYNGKFNDESIDTIFWRKVFKKFCHAPKIKFK